MSEKKKVPSLVYLILYGALTAWLGYEVYKGSQLTCPEGQVKARGTSGAICVVGTPAK